MNVYFVSGMGASCSAAFDAITLPDRFERKYIEWFVPHEDQSLDDYVRQLAKDIDTSKPFVLVGYSLGGVMVQEMNRFLKPHKTILIASARSRKEVSPLLDIIRKKREENNLANFDVDDFTIDLFMRLVYKVSYEGMKEFLFCIDPVYMRWSISQFYKWQPPNQLTNIYQIHGTKDQLFPNGHFEATHVIDKGDHLMINKHPKNISTALKPLLSDKKLAS